MNHVTTLGVDARFDVTRHNNFVVILILIETWVCRLPNQTCSSPTGSCGATHLDGSPAGLYTSTQGYDIPGVRREWCQGGRLLKESSVTPT